MTIRQTTGYQVMPALTGEEYAALKADIAEHGITVPILVDERQRVVDGHHRKLVADELGIKDYPVVIIVGRSDGQLRDMAYRLNVHRRHLSREQLREALAASLTADPGLSDRQHAVRVGSSPSTAGTVRRDLQEAGAVSKLDTRTDSTGRAQPATKPKQAGADVVALDRQPGPDEVIRRRVQEELWPRRKRVLSPAQWVAKHVLGLCGSFSMVPTMWSEEDVAGLTPEARTELGAMLREAAVELAAGRKHLRDLQKVFDDAGGAPGDPKT